MRTSYDLNIKNLGRRAITTFSKCWPTIVVAMIPAIAFASVDSSLEAVQAKLVGRILPLAATLGLIVAGISFTFGHQNARQHLVYAIVGAIVGFGAESIMHLVQMLIH